MNARALRDGVGIFVLLVAAAMSTRALFPAPLTDAASTAGSSPRASEPAATGTQASVQPLETFRRDTAAEIVEEPVATFSIVAYDPESGDLGVAVQSKFFGVGRVVPFAAAGVGAVATQSYANTTYGPRGLDLLRQGMEPEKTIAALTGDDPQRSQRQVGIVDARGNVASFTGDECLAWAGGRTGPSYAVQGNILAGPEVVDAMAETFEVVEGDLASRLVAALMAGQAAGGDARGRQSAALLVVRAQGGYGGFDDRYIDLRVEDHPTPIVELQRLLGMRHGQIAAGEARGALRQAAAVRDEARATILEDALALAERAVRLSPGDENAWMTLALVRLELGDHDGAAQAGIRALLANPWIKTAAVEGIAGADRGIEALLNIDAFRRVWETLPVR